MYTKAEHENEFWPSLVEKAYAKLHGGYNVIDRIPVTDILSDLTGIVYIRFIGFIRFIILTFIRFYLLQRWFRMWDYLLYSYGFRVKLFQS